jgi:predicted trehalose synthase
VSAPTAEWLGAQRWFAGTTATAPSAVDSTDLGADVRVAIVRVGDDHYQLLQVGDDRPDAIDDPRVGEALALGFVEQREVEGAAGRVRFVRAADRAPITGATRLIGTEQSNSSIVIGDQAILKVLRRLQPGPHPEIEMLGALSRLGSPYVPTLLGSMEVAGGPVDAVLGVLVEFVHDGRDGWGLVLELLADPGSTMAPLHALGTALGAIHRDLGSVRGDPAFRPTDGGKEVARTVADSVSRAAWTLAARLGERPGAGGLVVDLHDAAEEASHLADRLDAGLLIRHHGDLHLGQTLSTPRGWIIIDWEGEPARPLVERRTRHSPLRDVAGMLRSFSYAAATHARSTGRAQPEGWERAARAAFLDGYLTAVDPRLLPPSTSAIARLLQLLELEKVVYEIAYEADHRPDWLAIPATGLRVLLDRAAA